MKKHSVIFLLISFFNELTVTKSLSFRSMHDIIKFSERIMEIYSPPLYNAPPVNFALKVATQDTIQSMRKITQQIEELTLDVESEMNSISITLKHGIPIAGDVKTVVREFYNCVIRIEELYQLHKEYTSGPKFENRTIQNLVDTIISNNYGDLNDMLYHVYRQFVPRELSVIKRGILDFVIEERNAADPRIKCNSHISFQHTLEEFFNSAITSEVKGFILKAFSYKVLEGPFAVELGKAQREMIIRTNRYLEVTQDAMKTFSREIYNCDPPKHIWNVTYADLAFLFQKIVVNEIQVFPTETCSFDCYRINSNKIHRCYSWSTIPSRFRTYCQARDCRGRMHHCAWIGSVTLCELPGSSDRRYQWIESENGHYGNFDQKCEGYKKKVNKSMSGVFNCDNCLCDCAEEHEDSSATRTISLRPQVSNIGENMVISGVRFVLKDNVIHIQIEEAPLQPKGLIDEHNKSWIPLDDWVYMSNVSKGGFYIRKDNESIPMINGIDYSFITSNHRTLHLDDITSPYDHIITGVRFNHIWPPWPDGTIDSPLHLEVQVTPYDYDNGTIIFSLEDPPHWVSPETLYDPTEHYNRQREEFKIIRPDDPTEAPFNVPDSEPHQFIKFRTSDIWKDAGQSTVPFFDLQPITSLGEALDCIGIFHKGFKGYGGFITLKICTFDISAHLQPLSPEEVALYKSDRPYGS